MRILWAIASLTLVWGLCGPLSAQQDAAAAPIVHWQKPIAGFGDNEETAKKAALKNAKEMLDGLRAAMNPLVKTSDLSEDEVRKRFLVDAGEAEDDVNVLPFKKWVVTLRPESERLLRADERQTLSFILMIGLSMVLLAGVAYIRLDELTQRRYTTWLRVASVGVVTSALAGWWFIR